MKRVPVNRARPVVGVAVVMAAVAMAVGAVVVAMAAEATAAEAAAVDVATAAAVANGAADNPARKRARPLFRRAAAADIRALTRVCLLDPYGGSGYSGH